MDSGDSDSGGSCLC